MKETRDIATSARKTQKIAENLAKKIKKYRMKHALVVGLEGDLGGGKTTFVQGFARGLGITEKITSPTFVLLKIFRMSRASFKHFIHVDAYRIESPKELIMLGWQKILNDPQNIIMVEWADKIRKILPKDSIRITFQFVGRNKRKIIVHGG